MIWLVVALIGWSGLLTWKLWQYRQVIRNLAAWQTDILETLTNPDRMPRPVVPPALQPGVYHLDDASAGLVEQSQHRETRNRVLAQAAIGLYPTPTSGNGRPR